MGSSREIQPIKVRIGKRWEDLLTAAIKDGTRKSILLYPGEARDFMDEFRRVMLSEPRRTGIPENPPAQEMKAIWKEAS